MTDLVHLNRAVQNPTHPFALVQDILSSIEAGSKYFVKLDSLQIALEPESQKLIAFLRESGGMKYLRAPIGLTLSGDIFCHRTKKALADIPGVHMLVDDVFLTGKIMKQLIGSVFNVLEACLANGIILSAAKAQIGSSVKFSGFIADREGNRPDPVKTVAL